MTTKYIYIKRKGPDDIEMLESYFLNKIKDDNSIEYILNENGKIIAEN